MSRIASKIIQGAAGNTGSDYYWAAVYEIPEDSYRAPERYQIGVEIDPDLADGESPKVHIAATSPDYNNYQRIIEFDPDNSFAKTEEKTMTYSQYTYTTQYNSYCSYRMNDAFYVAGHRSGTVISPHLHKWNAGTTTRSAITVGSRDGSGNYSLMMLPDPDNNQFYFALLWDIDSNGRPWMASGKISTSLAGSSTYYTRYGDNHTSKPISINWEDDNKDSIIIVGQGMTQIGNYIERANFGVFNTSMVHSDTYYYSSSIASGVDKSACFAGCPDGNGSVVFSMRDFTRNEYTFVKASISDGSVEKIVRHYTSGGDSQARNMSLGKDGFIYGTWFNRSNSNYDIFKMDPSDLSLVYSMRITAGGGNLSHEIGGFTKDAQNEVYYGGRAGDYIVVIKIPPDVFTFSDSSGDFTLAATETTSSFSSETISNSTYIVQNPSMQQGAISVVKSPDNPSSFVDATFTNLDTSLEL